MKTLLDFKNEVSYRRFAKPYAELFIVHNQLEVTDEAAELYASEAIREKDETINKLKDRLEKAWQREDIKPKELDLIMQLAAKDKEIEQLRDRIQKHMSTLLSPEGITITDSTTVSILRYQGMQIALDMVNELVSRKNRQPTEPPEPFTGPVVGVEDDTPFTNRR